jgi:phospholipid/cholesterol/gamma-HCH transport system ATP-binding protein
VPDDAFIRFERVSFGYDASRLILHGIDLAFPRGKVSGILGGSGGGKTTLLRLIGGMARPTAGEVRVDGRPVPVDDPQALFTLRRRIGMLFQFGALFTDLDVFENVAFPLREHTDLDEPMVRDIVLMKLQAVGLRGAARMKLASLSGGMARRVALARAIALDPDLMLYDEPFTGLDPIALGVTAQLIRRLNDATGATSLVVTHDVQECFEICDHVVLLLGGRVAAQGRPADLRESSDPLVRQFIRGAPDGPVAFHHPAPTLAQDLGLAG